MNRDLLEKPFTPEQIKRRQGTNGDVLDYIEGCAVIQRLNECFDAEWIFEIQEHRVFDDEVVVLGKLTAQGVAKSQFGKSRITRAKKDNAVISLGDDLKAAATDCLKKCATLFGVGLHLYFDVGHTDMNGNGVVHSSGAGNGHSNCRHRTSCTGSCSRSHRKCSDRARRPTNRRLPTHGTILASARASGMVRYGRRCARGPDNPCPLRRRPVV